VSINWGEYSSLGVHCPILPDRKLSNWLILVPDHATYHGFSKYLTDVSLKFLAVIMKPVQFDQKLLEAQNHVLPHHWWSIRSGDTKMSVRPFLLGKFEIDFYKKEFVHKKVYQV
jgi:hypothetical protein